MELGKEEATITKMDLIKAYNEASKGLKPFLKPNDNLQPKGW